MEKNDMKMVVVIIQDENRHELSNLLIENGFRATQLTSTGSFLRAGNTTLMIGVEERRLEELLGVIRTVCTIRKPQAPLPTHLLNLPNAADELPAEVSRSSAIVFVLDIERFIRY